MTPAESRRIKHTVALYYWDLGGLSLLIPKRRGTGFLRVPYGHQSVPALSNIELAMRCDLCGLDGYLTFEVRMVEPDKQQAFVAKALPLVAAHFGFSEWRQVGSKEFFSHLL